jgi:meso-butanediol dehydrogenase/(S,S)-butanediol dehydrogenase/diacetyl reductase
VTHKRFENNVVIVICAGSGIGEASARHFLEEGAHVVFAARTGDGLRPTAKAIPATTQWFAHTCNVMVRSDVEALISSTIERFGRIDVVVNSADIGTIQSARGVTGETWRQALNKNLRSVFHIAQSALDPLMKTKGSIINVASVYGLGVEPGFDAHKASTEGLGSLIRSLAMEFRKLGVRVNAVSPRMMLTHLSKPCFDQQAEMKAAYEDRVVIGRGTRPDEVAAVITYLASADASHITGVDVPLGRGYSALRSQSFLI